MVVFAVVFGRENTGATVSRAVNLQVRQWSCTFLHVNVVSGTRLVYIECMQ